MPIDIVRIQCTLNNVYFFEKSDGDQLHATDQPETQFYTLKNNSCHFILTTNAYSVVRIIVSFHAGRMACMAVILIFLIFSFICKFKNLYRLDRRSELQSISMAIRKCK